MTRALAISFASLLRATPCALGAALASGLGAAPAFAQVQDPYRQHMENGVKLFADKNYAAAQAEFEAAYEAKPKASPLINIALCQKALWSSAGWA